MSVFQELHDSEINFSVSCFGAAGFKVRLGDDLNGYPAETVVEEWDDVERWLRAEAQRHFPESRFAKALLASI